MGGTTWHVDETDTNGVGGGGVRLGHCVEEDSSDMWASAVHETERTRRRGWAGGKDGPALLLGRRGDNLKFDFKSHHSKINMQQHECTYMIVNLYLILIS